MNDVDWSRAHPIPRSLVEVAGIMDGAFFLVSRALRALVISTIDLCVTVDTPGMPWGLLLRKKTK